MKAKYLFMALASLSMVACSVNDELPQAGTPGAGISAEKGYIAINLKSSDSITRAQYEDGTAAEQAVSKATFYFFDAAGNAFNINTNGNYFVATVADNGGTETPNIESMSDPVIVVEKYKGEFPAKIAAVVNYTGTTSLSLNDLQNTLSLVGHNNGAEFVMSNSVYANNAGEVIDATPLSIENFQTSSALALANPVTVFVERVVAKVNVKGTNTVLDTATKVGDKDVFAKINGWDLVATKGESYIIKSVNAAWTDTELGFVWSDPAYHRSYWTAKSVEGTVSNSFTPALLTNNDASVEYVGEYVNAANTDRTKYIVSATLQDASGNPIEIAQWYGTNYIGEEALLAAVAPTLKNKLMQLSSVGGVNTYTSIDDSQLTCVDGLANIESYEVGFALASGVATDNWYSFDGVNYTAVSDVNAVLATIQPAKVWKNGQAYYYADVKHLGEKGKVGEYGVVRNHSYQINISGVKGWGTPVYNPNTLIETPEKPSDKETYIAAEINVLSWRVVSQDVTLE